MLNTQYFNVQSDDAGFIATHATSNLIVRGDESNEIKFHNIDRAVALVLLVKNSDIKLLSIKKDRKSPSTLDMRIRLPEGKSFYDLELSEFKEKYENEANLGNQ